MDNPRLNKLSNGIKSSLRANAPFEAFQGMKVDSAEILDEIEGRTKCPECSKSRKFFCYTCYCIMPPFVGKLPKVKLPIEIAVVKHPQEIDGKSTATHGSILAPDHVKIYTYPDLPNTEKSILVYPSADAEDAVTFMERIKSQNEGKFPYERVIFVDSTWNQTYKICHDPNLVDLPKVKICGIESLFWRYQKGNPITHLATIEAMYHFCVTYHKHVINPGNYDGDYDNLLFFFKYMYFKIRNIYDPKTLRSYATRPYLQQ